jgi:hypothetical protein
MALTKPIFAGARLAFATGLRTRTLLPSKSPIAPVVVDERHYCGEFASKRDITTKSRAFKYDALHRKQPGQANFSSLPSTSSLLPDMLKGHRVFERIDVKPGKMFHVLNIIQEEASAAIGTTLQQAIVQELANNDLTEMDDMYYLVGCVVDSAQEHAARAEGCYDRIDDASDYHSLKEYLLGYKTHSFQMAVLPTLTEQEEGVLTELVRITQPGGFVVYISSTKPATVVEASTLQDDGKWKLIEAKPVEGEEGPTLNLYKVAA